MGVSDESDDIANVSEYMDECLISLVITDNRSYTLVN